MPAYVAVLLRLSLIHILMIAGSNLAQMLCDRRILSVVGIRMLLIPAVCFALFFACGFSGMAAGVVLLLEACPSAAITSVFAVQYSYDEEFAAGSVVITTLLSIVILPVCAMLLPGM